MYVWVAASLSGPPKLSLPGPLDTVFTHRLLESVTLCVKKLSGGVLV